MNYTLDFKIAMGNLIKINQHFANWCNKQHSRNEIEKKNNEQKKIEKGGMRQIDREREFSTKKKKRVNDLLNIYLVASLSII